MTATEGMYYMSRKNREKRARQNANPSVKKKETAWEAIKDLLLHPFKEDYNKNNTIGKFLGAVCLIAAFCLLFYITGHMI